MEFNGREVTVKVLTVLDIKNLLDSVVAADKARKGGENPPVSIIDILFNSPVSSEVITLATGLSREELEVDVDPKEVGALIDAVKAANPILTEMLTRLVKD